jgi:hypothetical protein
MTLRRLIPLVILALGVVLASAFGAQLGDQHAEYRVAGAAVAQAAGMVARAEEAGDATRITAAKVNLAAKQAAQQEIGLPQPGQRLGAWFSKGGIGWLVGCGLILGGAVMARRQIAAEQSGSSGEMDEADFPGTVAAALETLSNLEGRLAELKMDEDWAEGRDAIDVLMNERIGPLVDARGQLIAKHGLATFAEYFGPFSGGERNLGRLWSALTDGHADAAREASVAARAGFEEAGNRWTSAVSR